MSEDSLIPYSLGVFEEYFIMIALPIAMFLSLRSILLYLENWKDKDDN